MDETTTDTAQEQTVPDRSLSAREAAAELGVDERTIRRAIGRGDLVASKRGGVFQIVARDLASYRETHLRRSSVQVRLRGVVPLSGRESAVPGRVPTPLTSLIGREREVATIQELLRAPEGRRLIVLTGPGGVGKTRLALAIAAKAARLFADGVAYIPLASIRDPALVAGAIAKAVGVRERGSQPLAEQIVARVGDQDRLFVLDNFEHIVDAGPLLGELLTCCPRLTVLVTSRARLRLSGEHDFPVPPLALPVGDGQTGASGGSRGHPEGHGQSVSREIEQSAAVQLFVARAQAANSSFTLTAENASAVAEICRWLDGLPLAIELAAARATVLSTAALLARLDRRLPLLTDGPRDVPARQRTLRDAITWSYDLLDLVEQTFFRHLAVFAGGFSADAAARVSGIESVEAFALISSLVDKSLLQPVEHSNGEPRFGMLETIREYGLEQLQACREWEPVRRRHAEYFLAFAETAELKLRGRDQGAQVAVLETEHDNLRTALAWSLESADRAAYALRLAGALHWFWFLHDHYSEGRQWLEEALAGPAVEERTPARVKALAGAGLLAIQQNDHAAARDRLRQSFTLGREMGDTAGMTYALHVLGMWDLLQADHAQLRPLVEESVLLFRETGDRWGLATALCTLGMFAIAALRFDEANELFAESLALSREVGDTWGLARGLHYSGELARYRGDDEQARLFYDESLTLYQELGHRGAAAIVRHNLGYLAQHRGDLRQSLAYFADALAEHVTSGDLQNSGLCLGGVAGMVALLGQPEQAARLFGATDTLFESIGSSIWPIDRIDYDANLAEVRARLGEDAFAAAFRVGQALPFARAIAEAFALTDGLGVETKRGGAMTAAVTTSSLTPREIEVLQLLAGRATDREIAVELSISPRTVMHHVARIIAKLGVANRRDAAALVATSHVID
jgi:predicted ATPase/DNA-binding CsgD family transcriptional regulator